MRGAFACCYSYVLPNMLVHVGAPVRSCTSERCVWICSSSCVHACMHPFSKEELTQKKADGERDGQGKARSTQRNPCIHSLMSHGRFIRGTNCGGLADLFFVFFSASELVRRRAHDMHPPAAENNNHWDKLLLCVCFFSLHCGNLL